jgi:hypothetical protein
MIDYGAPRVGNPGVNLLALHHAVAREFDIEIKQDPMDGMELDM